MKLKLKEKKAVKSKENTALHYQTKITVLFAFLVVLLLFTPVLSSSTVIKAEITNLAPIPDGWSTANTNNENGIGGTPYIVYPISWQGKTAVRMYPNPAIYNGGWMAISEADSYSFRINPGDHIVFKVWLWAETSTIGDTSSEHGARIGIDIYARGRACEIATPDGQTMYPYYPEEYKELIVPWGSGQWVQKTIDFIVQSSYIADPWGAYFGGETIVPKAMIPWIAGYTHNPYTEKASVYFAGAELYIYSASSALTLSLSPQYVARGKQLTISGQLTPGQVTTIRLYHRFPHQWGAWDLACTLNTNAAGAYYAVATVPYSLSPGTHDLVAVWFNEATKTYIASPVTRFAVT